MKKWFKKISILSLIGSIGANLALGQVAAQEEKQFEGESVTVGVVGDSSERTWKYVAEKALEAEGIEIEVVLLSDYNQPNEALANGSLDLNAFQHVAFLENWNEANDQDLIPLAYTLVTKLGLYSDKHESIEDLPEGAQIAIPNDATNGGRALLALEIAGLIEVDDAVGILPTIQDITDNPLDIEIIELDAAQTALSLPDVDAAFINSGHASNVGLAPSDAIFVDTDQPEALNDAYRNIIASRAEDVDNELYLKIVELYQTPDVAEVIIEADDGGSVPAWEGYVPAEEEDAEEVTEEDTEEDSAE